MTLTNTENLFAQLDDELHHRGHGGRMDRRKVANNTYAIRRDDDTIAIRLHETDVVTVTRDNRVRLETGGWYTVTTKERINRYIPGWTAYSDRGTWYVRHYAAGWENSEAVRFFDGITIDLTTNEIVNPPADDAFDELDARNAEIEKAISRYVDGFTPEEAQRLIDAWKAGEGTAGDPWCCLMVAEDGSRPLAEGSDHLRLHIDEGYRFLSLLILVYEARRWGNPALVLQMHLRDLADTRGHRRRYGLKYELRRFLRRELIKGRAVK